MRSNFPNRFVLLLIAFFSISLAGCEAILMENIMDDHTNLPAKIIKSIDVIVTKKGPEELAEPELRVPVDIQGAQGKLLEIRGRLAPSPEDL